MGFSSSLKVDYTVTGSSVFAVGGRSPFGNEREPTVAEELRLIYVSILVVSIAFGGLLALWVIWTVKAAPRLVGRFRTRQREQGVQSIPRNFGVRTSQMHWEHGYILVI